MQYILTPRNKSSKMILKNETSPINTVVFMNVGFIAVFLKEMFDFSMPSYSERTSNWRTRVPRRQWRLYLPNIPAQVEVTHLLYVSHLIASPDKQSIVVYECCVAAPLQPAHSGGSLNSIHPQENSLIICLLSSKSNQIKTTTTSN